MRDYACNIFRFDFRNDDVCFFVWLYEMEQFRLMVERCFALISNQWGDLVCLLLGAAIFFLLSERLLSFNNAMITLTSAHWSARIVELASGIQHDVTCLSFQVDYFLDNPVPELF